jgi:hypothetical protein
MIMPVHKPLHITCAFAAMVVAVHAATTEPTTKGPVIPQGKHALIPGTLPRFSKKQIGTLPSFRKRDKVKFPAW